MDEIVKSIIDLAIRAAKAEDEALACKEKVEAANQQVLALNEKLEKLTEEYKTTDGAWKYKRHECEELKAKNDALIKEVEQLRAKMNTTEGFEEANNADRI